MYIGIMPQLEHQFVKQGFQPVHVGHSQQKYPLISPWCPVQGPTGRNVERITKIDIFAPVT